MSKRIVIIGGVAAGASAAAKARRTNKDAEIVMFEQGPYMSFANCGLPYYIGGEIPNRASLFVSDPFTFEVRFNIDLRLKTAVVAIDRDKQAGGTFKIAVKPPQVSAVVHRLVNIERGSIEHEAVVKYRIRYAPVDTFYLKMTEKLADLGVQISGANIREKPRIDELPSELRSETEKSEAEEIKWAYYKVVLQSGVSGNYQLRVRARRVFQAVGSKL